MKISSDTAHLIAHLKIGSFSYVEFEAVPLPSICDTQVWQAVKLDAPDIAEEDLKNKFHFTREEPEAFPAPPPFATAEGREADDFYAQSPRIEPRSGIRPDRHPASPERVPARGMELAGFLKNYPDRRRGARGADERLADLFDKIQ